MIGQGVWILVIILYGQRDEIKLVQYETYPSQVLCEAWKGRESKEYHVPMACIQEAGA